MPRKTDAAAALAEKMIQVLEAQQRRGPGSYPLTVRRLAELTDPQATPEQIHKAAAKKPFKDRAVVARAKNLEAPVALTEDAEALAGSPLLLEFALGLACSDKKPTAPVTSLKTKIDARLRPAFLAAVGRRVQEKTLPPTVETIQVARATHLHLLRIPLPEIQLAEQLISVLAAQRRLGGRSYPVPLNRLLELTGSRPPAALLKKALATEVFRNTAVMAAGKHANAPAALAEDREFLAGSPSLLEFALGALRKKDKHAFTVDALKKAVGGEFQATFVHVLKQRLDGDWLPATVAWIWSGGKKQLFLLADVHPGREEAGDGPRATVESVRPSHPDGQPPVSVTADFAAAFDSAFEQLNRQAGAHNFVSLVDMRRALPLPRATFDSGLRQQRLAGRYSLSAAEGRHGTSPEEREAGIVEDGALLLYVSRKCR